LNREDFFISKISQNSKHIGDDGAFIDGYVYSKDCFFENIHFKRNWMSLREIAKKSMMINISDAIVMNSYPKYALIGIAIPKSFSRADIEELTEGFLEASREFEIEIIGGDTIANTKLDISITIISKCKKPIFRKGLRANSLIAYTGNVGDVKRDLNIVLRGGSIPKNSKFRDVKLKPKLFYELSKYMQIAMDISDGIAFELERIAKLNRVTFKLFTKLSKNELTSGEEYEIIFGFDKKNLKKVQAIAKKYRVKLNIFAKTKRGKYINNFKNHHF
jgi:thiamine-monophosphate kinase